MRSCCDLNYRKLVQNEDWRNPDVPLAILLAQYMDSDVAMVHRITSLVEGATGVALVHPMADPEIIQIASSLTWELRHGREGGRMLLRRAMRGILPEEIRLRTTKCSFNVFFQRYFASSLETQPFREGGKRLEFLLNDSWDSLRKNAQKDVPYAALAPIFRIGLVGAWLREHGLGG
jgi:asparagine synthetase B (glutamine-hydrolysing)